MTTSPSKRRLSRRSSVFARLGALLFLAAAPLIPSSAHAGPTRASVLDPDYYLKHNKDVAKALGNTSAAAMSHWYQSGRNEGRRPSAALSFQAYLHRYPDLEAAFGSNVAAALDHYVEFGWSEGRDAGPAPTKSNMFNAAWYLQAYPDVGHILGHSEQAAMEHWLRHGIGEGRMPNPYFSPEAYLNRYIDLKKAFPGSSRYAAALNHYINHGWKEGRYGTPRPSARSVVATQWYARNHKSAKTAAKQGGQGVLVHWYTEGAKAGLAASACFDPKVYVERSPDLKKAFGTNYIAAIEHYTRVGWTEPRFVMPKPTIDALLDPVFYLSHYPDLKAAFGEDYDAAYNHWRNHGIYEGRAPSECFDPSGYASRNPDVQAHAKRTGGADARLYWYAMVDHYIQYGWREGRSGAPSRFAPKKLVLRNNPELLKSYESLKKVPLYAWPYTQPDKSQHPHSMDRVSANAMASFDQKTHSITGLGTAKKSGDITKVLSNARLYPRGTKVKSDGSARSVAKYTSSLGREYKSLEKILNLLSKYAGAKSPLALTDIKIVDTEDDEVFAIEGKASSKGLVKRLLSPPPGLPSPPGAKDAIKALSFIEDTVRKLATDQGLLDPMPTRVAIETDGSSASLVIQVTFWRGSIDTSLGPKQVSTGFHFQELRTKLVIDQEGSIAVGIGFDGHFKPRMNHWLKLKDAEFMWQGGNQYTVGGELKGACPNGYKKACKSAWNLYKLGLVYVRAGKVEVEFTGIKPTGATGEIKDARLMSANGSVRVNGVYDVGPTKQVIKLQVENFNETVLAELRSITKNTPAKFAEPFLAGMLQNLTFEGLTHEIDPRSGKPPVCEVKFRVFGKLERVSTCPDPKVTLAAIIVSRLESGEGIDSIIGDYLKNPDKVANVFINAAGYTPPFSFLAAKVHGEVKGVPIVGDVAGAGLGALRAAEAAQKKALNFAKSTPKAVVDAVTNPVKTAELLVSSASTVVTEVGGAVGGAVVSVFSSIW